MPLERIKVLLLCLHWGKIHLHRDSSHMQGNSPPFRFTCAQLLCFLSHVARRETSWHVHPWPERTCVWPWRCSWWECSSPSLWLWISPSQNHHHCWRKSTVVTICICQGEDKGEGVIWAAWHTLIWWRVFPQCTWLILCGQRMGSYRGIQSRIPVGLQRERNRWI